MRLLAIVVFLGLLMTGCESEEQKHAKDAINACAEIGQTTRGFGGPSDRMQILKSYGWEPVEAVALETILDLRSGFADSAKTSCETDGVGAKCECIRRGMAMLSCEIGYAAILTGTQNAILEGAINIFEQC